MLNETIKLLERIKEFYGIKTDTALAEKLGISHATLSNWKRRDSSDLPLIIKVCKEINLEWLFRSDVNNMKTNSSNEIKHDYNAELESLKEELKKSEERIEVLSNSPFHSEINSFPNANSLDELTRLLKENSELKDLIVRLTTKLMDCKE